MLKGASQGETLWAIRAVGSGEAIFSQGIAEKLLLQEMPIAPSYFRTQAFIVKPYVKGLILPPMGGDYEFKWTSIER